MRAVRLVLLYVLAMFGLFMKGQGVCDFREPSVQTVIKKTSAENIKVSGKTDWELFTKEAQDDNGLISLFAGNYISSISYLDITPFSEINIELDIRHYNSSFDENACNLLICLEYETGEIIEQKTNIEDLLKEVTRINVCFASPKGGSAKIVIKSQAYSQWQFCYIYNISASGIKKVNGVSSSASSREAEVNIDQHMNSYDKYVFSLYYPRKDNDTIYFEDFSDKVADGWSFVGNPSMMSDPYLYLSGSKGAKISMTQKFKTGYINNPVELSFSFKAGVENLYKNTCRKLKIYIDNELLQTIDPIAEAVPGPNVYETMGKYQFSIVTDKKEIELKLAIEDATSKENVNLLIDDICLRGEMYSYVQVDGYPLEFSGPVYSMQNLYPNTQYMFGLQGLDVAEDGTEVASAILYDGFITTGENKYVAKGEVFELTEDFVGNITIEEGGTVKGNHTVLGEVCYIMTYVKDEWKTLSLPFDPFLVGAYQQEKGIYLRPKYDYYLQQYTMKDDGYVSFLFEDKDGINKGEGYIFKVPATIQQYDNYKIFIFSDKGTELNAPVTPADCQKECFEHIGNPYTFEMKASELCNATVVYILENGRFVKSSPDVTIKAFESFIAYNTSIFNRAPKAIEIGEVLDINSLETSNTEILVYDETRFSVNGFSGRLSVTDINGKVVFDGNVYDGEIITVPDRGVYILNMNGKFFTKIRL